MAPPTVVPIVGIRDRVQRQLSRGDVVAIDDGPPIAAVSIDAVGTFLELV